MDFVIIDSISLEELIKLSVAAVLSLIIGIERELKKKPVGLKTSLVISTFSCLLTIISIDNAYNVPARDDVNITLDPLRLAAQIVSGIGFLGAGVILRKGNDSIKGLTTAAIIWGAGAIGIAVGAGFYIQALVTVILVVIGIEVIAPLLWKIGPRRLRMREISLKVKLYEEKNLKNLMTFMKENEMFIDNIRIRDVESLNEQYLYDVDIRFSTLLKLDTFELYSILRSLPYIKNIEIEILA